MTSKKRITLIINAFSRDINDPLVVTVDATNPADVMASAKVALCEADVPGYDGGIDQAEQHWNTVQADVMLVIPGHVDARHVVDESSEVEAIAVCIASMTE